MSQIKAIFFDMDGVIVDTEKDGHRVAFNQTFSEFGFPFQWSVEHYGELLKISGGKERMRHDFQQRRADGLEIEQTDEIIKKLHKRKTDIMVSLIESGQLPLRPGVHRFMKEARAQGIVLGVCTTANERAAAAVTKGLLGDIDFAFVLAGDMVSKKKPDPEIYLSALDKSGLSPESCLVVEDSHNGIKAARAAGLPVLVTTNLYTESEDLSQGEIIVTCLGDPDGEQAEVKKAAKPVAAGGVLRVSELTEYFTG